MTTFLILIIPMLVTGHVLFLTDYKAMRTKDIIVSMIHAIKTHPCEIHEIKKQYYL